MRAVGLILLILSLSAGSCFAQAPPVCPWLSTGSAADALGGPVRLDLHLEGSSLGTCRFVSGSGSDQAAIQITIVKVDTHACPAGSTRMVGLGNEAVECRRTGAGTPSLATIAGRVRDVYFVIGMSSSHEDPMASPVLHRGDPDHPSVLELVAEQVVGNLY
jgi:hypothetical protein